MRVAQLVNYQPKKFQAKEIRVLENPGSRQRVRAQIDKIAASAMAAVVMERGDTAPSKNINWQTWRALQKGAGSTNRVTAGLTSCLHYVFRPECLRYIK